MNTQVNVMDSVDQSGRAKAAGMDAKKPEAQDQLKVMMIDYRDDVVSEAKTIFEFLGEVFVAPPMEDGVVNYREINFDEILCIWVGGDKEAWAKEQVNEILSFDDETPIVLSGEYNLTKADLPAEQQRSILGRVAMPPSYSLMMDTLHRCKIFREHYCSNSRNKRKDGKREGELFRSLVGTSRGIIRVRELMGQVADKDVNVLITGESGTGKEVVARNLHFHSYRRHKPFVPVNCGAIPAELLESELFGHEKGAFTGAAQQKAGAFETADGGTLFLDELGELPLDMQPKLLRVLENNEVRRLGSSKSFQVDVRVIAATNRRLEEEVAAGRFREDLLHRLNIVQIELPPLRKRAGDIGLLAQYFVEAFSPSGESVVLSEGATRRLEEHLWPGNIRELRNIIQRAVLMRLGESIEAEDITFPASTLASRVEVSEAVSSRTLAEIEREAIRDELIRHQGNKKEAAKALGVSRSTIHRKIEEYQIELKPILGGLFRFDRASSFVFEALAHFVVADEESQVSVQRVLARRCGCELRCDTFLSALWIDKVLCGVLFLFDFDAVTSLQHGFKWSFGFQYMASSRLDGELTATLCACFDCSSRIVVQGVPIGSVGVVGCHGCG
ncbi:MAG TPA: sigma-54-dependent Fis family transcriptional regulator [Gammaproteobacteria bacterium]|nr:sigma-54-dependent Fis family transcriptional regulator [Gammaproteobacteria bacterium]